LEVEVDKAKADEGNLYIYIIHFTHPISSFTLRKTRPIDTPQDNNVVWLNNATNISSFVYLLPLVAVPG
jgi:hypothetical protein